MIEPETIYCYPCNMHFRVAAPSRKDIQRTACAECGRYFWHTGHSGRKGARPSSASGRCPPR